MVYVALLRGVNVGGKAIVSMANLARSFEAIGFTDVQTLLHSGNVVFRTSEPRRRLPQVLEARIKADFGLDILVVLRSLPQIEALVATMPADWGHDAECKTDVMFLRPEIDEPTIIDRLSWQPAHESVRYLPGTLIWHTSREYGQQSKLPTSLRGNLSQHLTVRNPNTVRKLLAAMQEL